MKFADVMTEPVYNWTPARRAHHSLKLLAARVERHKRWLQRSPALLNDVVEIRLDAIRHFHLVYIIKEQVRGGNTGVNH